MQLLKISLLVFLFSTCLLPQGPDTVWTKTYGGPYSDKVYSVDTTLDGGYIFTGAKQTSFFGNGNLWIVKTDDLGDTIWTKTIGDSSYTLRGKFIRQLSVNEYIIIGDGWINGVRGHFLIKTNSIGDTLWTRYLGNGQVINQLDLTSDGGFILVGALNYNCISLIKTNANGDTIWTNRFYSGSLPPGDEGFSVKQTFDGGYVIAGRNMLESCAWLIKTDNLGNLEWEKTWGLTTGFSVTQTNDSNLIMVGTSIGGGMGAVKTNMSGQMYWQHSFGNGGNAFTVIETFDNNYVMIGSTCRIIKFDRYGQLIWLKDIETTYLSDPGNYIKQNSEGSLIILGVINLSPETEEDARLIKLNSDPTDVTSENEIIINKYHLSQNYPNPFNPSTKIKFTIPSVTLRQVQSDILVTIKVYDLLGREVATLVNEEKPAGEYEVEFNGVNLPSGIYFYQLKAGQYSETKKMVLIK